MPSTAAAKRTEKLFADAGLRCTRQRKAVYEALCRSRSHPTADELYRQVRDATRGMSLATVYNSLEALCQAGLVQKLPGVGANGSARYDAVCDNHLHVRCQKTGTVADVPEDVSRQITERIPPELLEEIERKLGFHVSQVQIELVGEYQKHR